MTQAQTRFRSIEEYLDYDDGSDIRYELVQGELVEMPTEGPINLLIATALLLYFAQMGILTYRLGIKHQVAVPSAQVTAREPDLIVHSEASAIALLSQTQALLTLDMPAPWLVVEVVSPGKPGSKNYQRDYVEKPKEYAEREIPEFWLVDPDRALVTVLVLQAGVYRSHTFRGSDHIVSPTFPTLLLTAEQVLQTRH